MGAQGTVVNVGTTPTLIFEVVDAATYGTYENPPDNVFVAQTSGDELPILMIFNATSTIYLGGKNVSTTGANIGALSTGFVTLAYNVAGGDSLYGIVGAATQPVQLLTLKQ